MATDKDASKTSSNTIEPGDLGKLLVEYREAAQLNIDQISDSLCLTTVVVRSLESESFDKLPEPPYVRGYLRNYAGLVHKDPKPLIDLYNTLIGSSPTVDDNLFSGSAIDAQQELTNPIITPQRFRLALLTVLLILLGLLTMIPAVRDWTSNLWINFSPTSDTTSIIDGADTETSLNLPSLTGDVPGNLPITPVEAQVETKVKTEPASEIQPANEETATETEGSQTNSPDNHESDTPSEPETTTTDENSTDDNGGTDTAEGNAEESTAENENTSAQGNTQLKLVFTEEVWIRIRNKSGKTIFEALHPANTEKELSLNSPLKFRVGNAPGMILFVNGKKMDISQFTQGSVAIFGIE
ncbi:MAG: RodZ domain-containing protein [Thiotrichaceae bacterium]